MRFLCVCSNLYEIDFTLPLMSEAVCISHLQVSTETQLSCCLVAAQGPHRKGLSDTPLPPVQSFTSLQD